MIRYALKCDQNHEFEAWFASSAAYDALAKAGQVTCAVCGASNVGKALMAPNVVTSRKRSSAPEQAKGVAQAAPDTSDAQKAWNEAVQQVRQYVKSHAEYVGPRFAEEARKIHYEEVPNRGIYGEATSEDTRALREEGIDFHPLPALPDDLN